jgi:hypothetical protein
VRLDRKLLLIAPTIVLVLVIAGVAYAASELHVLTAVSDSEHQRSTFIAAVARGDKPLTEQQAVGMLQFALDVETKRTAAIAAAHDLLVALVIIGAVACVVLAVGVRGVPRVHWPRLGQRPGDE